MTIYKRRKKFDSLSIRVGMIFSRVPLSPNQWTIVTFIPALFGFTSAYYGNIYAAVVLFAITAFIDIIDGSVARVSGRVTRLGAFLDTIVDRYIEFIMIAAILFLNLPNFYFPIYIWLLLLLFGSMMSTYAKSASAEKNISKENVCGIRGGILEHSDRMILLFLVFLLAVLIDGMYVTYLVVLMAVLSNISAFQRILYAYNAAKKQL